MTETTQCAMCIDGVVDGPRVRSCPYCSGEGEHDGGVDRRAEFDRRVLESIQRDKYGRSPLNGEAL
jgi:hypothetical protein